MNEQKKWEETLAREKKQAEGIEDKIIQIQKRKAK